MKHIQNIAFNILKNLQTYDISVDELKEVIAQHGYTVVEYNKTSNSKNVELILNELHLKDYSRTVNAFAYADKSSRIVFVHNGLSDSETIILLAHEAGHILLGHMTDSNGICGTDITFENEANEFSHYLIHPGFSAKLKLFLEFNKKMIALICAILISAVVISVSIYKAVEINIKNKNVQSSDTSYSENGDEVYVTESGNRYHHSWCTYIKNKEGLKKLSIDEAEIRYQPCKVCFPEKSE